MAVVITLIVIVIVLAVGWTVFVKKPPAAPPIAKGDVIWECAGEGFTASLVALNVYHGTEVDAELRVRPTSGYIITKMEFTPPPSANFPATLFVTPKRLADEGRVMVTVPGRPIKNGRTITVIKMRFLADCRPAPPD
jgi:hypothetical protein